MDAAEGPGATVDLGAEDVGQGAAATAAAHDPGAEVAAGPVDDPGAAARVGAAARAGAGPPSPGPGLGAGPGVKASRRASPDRHLR